MPPFAQEAIRELAALPQFIAIDDPSSFGEGWLLNAFNGCRVAAFRGGLRLEFPQRIDLLKSAEGAKKFVSAMRLQADLAQTKVMVSELP